MRIFEEVTLNYYRCSFFATFMHTLVQPYANELKIWDSKDICFLFVREEKDITTRNSQNWSTIHHILIEKCLLFYV